MPADLIADPPLAAPTAVTAALWTPQGRGAVATIKVCGALDALLDQPDFHVPFRAANGRSLTAQPIGRICFGYWGADPTEEVVVCRTHPAELEIHCHGGQAAARRILADWEALQIPTISWQQQSVAAAGSWATDCRIASTQATTLRTAGILLDQEAAWRNFADRVLLLTRSGEWNTLRNEVAAALAWRGLGRHLIEPFQIVLTGPPNVGKSALLNALVGYQRSVVFDQPGTTRDIVTAETAFDGWPVRLIDTAGLRDDALGLEAQGIELAREQLAIADLLLQVRDATVPVPADSPQLAAQTTTIHVTNKIDLAGELPEWSLRSLESPPTIPVSAKTGMGIEQLIAEIARRLVPQTPAPGTLVPFREHHVHWLEELDAALVRHSAAGTTEFAQRI